MKTFLKAVGIILIVGLLIISFLNKKEIPTTVADLGLSNPEFEKASPYTPIPAPSRTTTAIGYGILAWGLFFGALIAPYILMAFPQPLEWIILLLGGIFLPIFLQKYQMCQNSETIILTTHILICGIISATLHYSATNKWKGLVLMTVLTSFAWFAKIFLF